jgi:hypothetical protein
MAPKGNDMIHWQEHHGKPPGRERHTVVDAQTGKMVLERATEAEFDRWYDAPHAFWRKPRAVEEVAPELRAVYLARHDLAEGETRLHYLVNECIVLAAS